MSKNTAKTAPDPITIALKAAGLRITPQRYAVYANLLARQDHPTAEQLLSDLNHHLPLSSQATIYNSLQTLCEVGLIREVLLQQGVSRYDAKVTPHHHFVCHHCGTIQDLAWQSFPLLDLEPLDKPLQPDSYEITVHGFCGKC